MAKYIKETKIAASAEHVFAFHERPDALNLLVPPWEKVTVEIPPKSLAVGTTVVLVNHIGPIRLRWVAEHSAYDPPRSFQDFQKSGPFRKWVHTHWVIPESENSCKLRDEIEYELPFGVLGRTLGGWYVRSKIDRMFKFRHLVTQRECEKSLV